MSDARERVEMGSASAQLELIESMMQEGRRTTEYWGWNFLLWGATSFIAMFWSSALTNSRSAVWAWPVMMTMSGLLTGWIGSARNKGNPVTLRSRALTAIWMGVGFGIGVFAFPAILTHRLGDGHLFIAAIEVLLGAAHLAGGTVLQWRLQVSVGVLWWTSAVITLFVGSDLGLLVPFVAGNLICNVGFGAYLMVMEARAKAKLPRVSHA